MDLQSSIDWINAFAPVWASFMVGLVILLVIIAFVWMFFQKIRSG